MTAKVGVLSNRRARRFRRRGFPRDAFARLLGNRGLLRETEDVGDVRGVLEEFQREGVELVCVSGGDGTLQTVLTGLIEVHSGEALPVILPLCAGTMNTSARGLGVRGRPLELVERGLHWLDAKGGRPTAQRDTLRLRSPAWGLDEYGFLFGVGLVYNFLDRYYEDADPNPMTAAKVIVEGVSAAFAGRGGIHPLFRQVEGKFTIDGQALPFTRVTALLAGTIEEIGLGFRPLYRAFERPGMFHVIATAMPPVHIARSLHKLYSGRPIRRPDTRDTLSERIEMELSAPPCYTIDGENSAGRPDRPGPHKLELMCGPSVQIPILAP